MQDRNASTLCQLVMAALGSNAGAAALEAIMVDEELLAEQGSSVSRETFAMALAIVLFDGLVRRVPSGLIYGARCAARGKRVVMDHGALRTIRFPHGPTGTLPAGQLAFARILEPLGYEVAETYPLSRLRMTGYGYRQQDLPEIIPQYFVSELHVDAFDAEFGAVARRVFGTSVDPLGAIELALLDSFSRTRSAPFHLAKAGLPGIAAAFGRHHAPFAIEDYTALLERSAEAAWIATEGNAFNHATDRVTDVEALADALRSEGMPIKDRVEISASGRVRQTALRAEPVERDFLGPDGAAVRRTVPGSFYEFITRHLDPASGRLDLAFDSSNATGIFAMTRAA